MWWCGIAYHVMATSSDSDALMDEFLDHGTEAPETWDRSYNKLQCPDCGGLHEEDAVTCGVCGWEPTAR
jgi:acetone carboxylase gamma subunit